MGEPHPKNPKQPDQQLHYPNNNNKKPVNSVAVCSLLVFISGAVLIIWWSVHFHPSNHQLWMVPLGLVLIGTPMIVSCSVLASGQRPVAPELAVEPLDLEK